MWTLLVNPHPIAGSILEYSLYVNSQVKITDRIIMLLSATSSCLNVKVRNPPQQPIAIDTTAYTAFQPAKSLEEISILTTMLADGCVIMQ